MLAFHSKIIHSLKIKIQFSFQVGDWMLLFPTCPVQQYRMKTALHGNIFVGIFAGLFHTFITANISFLICSHQIY